MNSQNIRFLHFYDKSSYCKLQDYFGSFDYQNRYMDPITTPHDDFTITNYELDEFSREEYYEDLSFIDDFLYPRISNLSLNYIDNFKDEINKKGLYSKELLDGFAKDYRQRILEIKKSIKSCEFHSTRTKLLVSCQILEIEEYVEMYFNNPYPKIKSKMQFNWNRTKIIYLFHLLRENKEMEWIEDCDIGRIIDNVFEYQDPKNDDNYLSIADSRKHFNDFKKMGGRTEKTVNEELKKIFMNEDFYNV